MRTIVFLDDERNPEDVTWMPAYKSKDINWIIVRTFQQFRDFVDTLTDQQIVSYAWGFDHDIQDFDFKTGREKTGKDCLDFLLMECLHKGISLPVCYFHTMNPVGKLNMERLYQHAMRAKYR